METLNAARPAISDMIQQIIETEAAFSIYQRKEGGVQSIIGDKEAIEIGIGKPFCEAPNEPKPYYTSLQFAVRMLFNRTVGTLTYEPSDAAELLAGALHFNPFDGLSEMLFCDRQPVEHTEDSDGHSIKTLNFVTGGGVDLVRPQVAAPVLTGTATVTATCATAGATMFYTLDGTTPSPRNPGATLYTVPVAVLSGQTIKVSAGLEGYFRNLSSYTRP
jgi:hypothetical protein